MSIFVVATEAERPKNQTSHPAALMLGIFLVIMVVAQLFTYEKFPDVINSLGFFSNKSIATVAAALIVTLEVAALPFLLRMKLSPLARIASMAAGWLMLLFWLILSIWLNVTLSLSSNGGVLGGTVPLPVDLWMVTFFVMLSALDIWACYGLWPKVLSPKK